METGLNFHRCFLTNPPNKILRRAENSNMHSGNQQLDTPKSLEDRRFFELLEFAPDAFFQGDPQGNFILVNSKAISLTGYSREDLLRMNMKDLFSSSQLASAPLQYNRLEQTESLIVQRDINTRSGEIKKVEMSSKKNTDGTYQCFMRDVTEKVRIEQHYNEIQQRYQLAFHTSPDAITINDIRGIYIDVNKGFCDITGFKREEIVGKNSVDLGIWVNAEDREQMVFSA